MPDQFNALNARQQRFVAEYAVDGNGTQAAIRAGYSSRGAEVTAYQLLRNPKIVGALAEARAKIEIRTSITQDQVLAEVAKLAFSSVQNYTLDESGNLALREGVPESAWGAVASVKYKTITTKSGDVIRICEFKLWSKPDALRLAAQHLGMLIDRHVVWDISQMTPKQLAEVERRALAGEAMEQIMAAFSAREVGDTAPSVN